MSTEASATRPSTRSRSAGSSSAPAPGWHPNLSGRLFGLDPEGNPQPAYLGRLFGARDVALGAGVLRSPRRSRRTPGSTAGLACDVADVGAGVLAGVRGQLPPAAAALVTATAAVFAVAGVWLLQQ